MQCAAILRDLGKTLLEPSVASESKECRCVSIPSIIPLWCCNGHSYHINTVEKL